MRDDDNDNDDRCSHVESPVESDGGEGTGWYSLGRVYPMMNAMNVELIVRPRGHDHD